MSETQSTEITIEQKLKNTEYQLERATNVIKNVNHSLSNINGELDSTQKYNVVSSIERLNQELVEVTSKLITSGNKDMELLVRQAHITGKLEILNETIKNNEKMLNSFRSLIITTSTSNK